MEEHLGRRIAALRAKRGWTQQLLADRLAVSRVAISHLEAGMSWPGERTVALLAGVFKLEPHELVAGTSYPKAKADRLPLVTARYTQVEQALELLAADLAWLARTGGAFDRQVLLEWDARLLALVGEARDPEERGLVEVARRRVRSLLDAALA
ncbi:MAG TPA: helix-turn-helix transcriptional regulator [Acidimicrobiales bacterium]|nr:helix-turn-helix transcriptional regulator [Acidimicrobiales bacterium]